MSRVLPWLGQLTFYSLLMLLVASFSDAPAYSQMAADQALIKLAFSHTSKRIAPCHKRTAEGLAALPAHMRRSLDCPRERAPIHIELTLDGEIIYNRKVEPAGISKDGRTSVYQRIILSAGTHQLRLRMADDIRTTEFTYVFERQVDMQPGQVLVIDFDSERDSFFIQ